MTARKKPASGVRRAKSGVRRTGTTTPRRGPALPRGRRDARIDTAREAIALVERSGAITLVPVGDRPSLVAAVVGGPVSGSWWGHPRGKVIYELATALESSGQVLVTKLIDGKITFVHRALWPALVRVLTDPGERESRREALPAPARALFDKVERDGTVRSDGAADRAARRALEESALVHSTSEHTDKGHHATVLTSWSAWAPAEITRSASTMGLHAARAQLANAGIAL